MMKFSEETMRILKNFSEIKPNILFKPGNEIRTMSKSKTVMAKAKLNETIEKEAGVFDLSRFISAVTMFSETPDIQFKDKYFDIKANHSSIKYKYGDKTMLGHLPPDRDIPINDDDVLVVFNLSWENIQSITRAASILQSKHIFFVLDGENVKVTTGTNNKASNTFELDVAKEQTQRFSKYIKFEFLKLIPADYTVTVTDGFVHFKTNNVEYWIAYEEDD